MVKVLVADENIEETNKCCQYLSYNEPKLDTGIETLNKYNRMKANILILNSHFSDINSTEIVDRLSSTAYERKNSNILLTINNAKEQLNFFNTEKIYGFFSKPLDLEKIFNAIKQIQNDNNFDDLDEDFLNKLFLGLYITVGSFHTEILKEAIEECYKYPYLLDNFDLVLSILSNKHYSMTTEDVRNAIRSALHKLNIHKEKLNSHYIARMFEPNKNITPKQFLEVVVSYLHIKKNQKIIL